MDNIIEDIYKKQILNLTISEYKWCDNENRKKELYEKIKQLLIELNML